MDQTMQDNIVKIISLTCNLEDNQFACWSRTTHIIFEDYNIGRYHIEHALFHKDLNIWRIALIDQMARYDPAIPLEYQDILQEVIDTFQTLLELYQYSETELDIAAHILWTDYEGLAQEYNVTEMLARALNARGRSDIKDSSDEKE